MIISLPNSEAIATSIAKKLCQKHIVLEKDYFPDGELYVRFPASVRGENVVLVRSFQPEPQEALCEVLWAGMTARRLGARKVTLVAPYLGYVRQDKEFNPGEAISVRVSGELIGHAVDKVVTLDPHLHRIKDLSSVYGCPVSALTANTLLADFIVKKYGKGIIVGPDEESEQWAARIARSIGWQSTVLKKTRYSSRHVRVELKEQLDVKNKTVVIVDDIISTGDTVAKAALLVSKMKPGKIAAVCVHGLFAENALKKLRSAGISSVACTNTIKNAHAQMDCAGLLAGELQ